MNNFGIGERLNQTLKYEGVTQEECAKKVGISRAHMNRICNGEKKIFVEHLLKICSVLNTTPNDILGFNDTPTLKAQRELKNLKDKIRKAKKALSFSKDECLDHPDWEKK